jgi:flagellin
MTVAISTQMSANLVSLMSVNSEMAGVQDRLATGKKVNSVLDGAAVYFRAKALTEKAQAYDSVNANINAALSNVKVADKAINTMYSNLDSLLTTLRDARSKSVAITNAASTSNATATAYTGTTTLVDTAPANNDKAWDNETRFQDGDVFAMSYTDGNNNTVTRYFKAVSGTPATGKTGVPVANATTVSTIAAATANAIEFNSATGLQAAVETAFGRDAIQLDFANEKFSLRAVSAATTITLAQIVNFTPTNTAGASLVPAGTNNAVLDFEKIFGAPSATSIINRIGGNGASVATGLGTAGAATYPIVGTGITLSGTGTAATTANLETRRLAADTYRVTLQQLNNIVRDAYMPGFVNLLQGNTMEVNLNEDFGDVVQNVRIGGPVDPASLGFFGFVPLTGEDNNSATNFRDDTVIGTAINRVTAAMTALRSRQNALANHTTMLSTRLDFNKSFQGIVGDAASAITAADANEEAATMAALQNRQAYAVNNLSVTKGAEQSLLQLLR